MAPKVFDHQRVQASLYHKLDDPRVSASFVSLVMDYMEYLRSVPQHGESPDTDQEMQVAQEFVKMVNNDVAWPLARQVVPEFRTEAMETTRVSDPLQYVLDAVRSRLPTPRPEPRSYYIPRYEEELHWRRQRAQIEYLAYGAGGKDEASPTRQQEAERTISMFKDIQAPYIQRDEESTQISKEYTVEEQRTPDEVPQTSEDNIDRDQQPQRGTKSGAKGRRAQQVQPRRGRGNKKIEEYFHKDEVENEEDKERHRG